MSFIWSLPLKNTCRQCCSCLKSTTGQRQKSMLNTKPRLKLRSFLLTRYLEFMKKYEDAMEKKFPRAVNLYRVFSVGIKEFKEDLFCLFQVFNKNKLSLRDLEVAHRMPKEMIKVAPVLLIAVIPGGGIIFPVAYMFPRLLLTHHFWSLQQRSEFATTEHKQKLTHFRPVFRNLQGQLRSIKDDPTKHAAWSKVLGLLGSGVHPDPEMILECKDLFERKPYHLSALSTLHTSHLLQMHGMHRVWWRRTRLAERARLIQRMDRAMESEGGPEALSADQLRRVCFFRGLNPVNVSQKDAMEWLHRWLVISREVNGQSYSLLLHCPVLLGYNEPSNWLLLHDTRTEDIPSLPGATVLTNDETHVSIPSCNNGTYTLNQIRRNHSTQDFVITNTSNDLIRRFE